MEEMNRLILASGSPRRKSILTQVGFKFDVIESDYEEEMNQTSDPRELVQMLSRGKAEAVAKNISHGIVLGADTIVVANGEIIGKPKDDNDATRILTMLSGASHRVITGFTIIDAASGKTVTRFEETVVFFRSLSHSEISDYIASGEPTGKAGAYGAQDKGALFISHIKGDFYNVVGLPISHVAAELKNFGISAIINV